MVPIPVFCDNCGTIFVAENIFGGPGPITLKNVGIGPCPTCGGNGLALDGTYEFIDGVLNILNAPAWSLQKLGWLETRLRAAQAQTATAPAVLDEVSAADPGLADYIQPALQRGWTVLQVIAVILTIIVFMQAETQHGGGAAAEQVERIIQSLPTTPQQHDSARTRPPPKPRTTAKRPKKAPKTYGRTKRKGPRK